MEPRIQYARTKDGVSIAFATYGEGQPLVWSHPPAPSHIQLEWDQPVLRAAFSRLTAMGIRLIRFDLRGVGLSDRDVNDLSLDTRVRDLEAVVDRLRLRSFALVALEGGGPAAIAYAVRHPKRVSHLILVNCAARRIATPSGNALVRLLGEDDWEMLTENMAASAFGYGGQDTKRYAEFLRACTTPDMLRRLVQISSEIDVSHLLGRIRTPTLVVRHTGMKWPAIDATRELASGIPDSRLLLIEGLYPDNREQLFRGIADFLGRGEAVEGGAQPPEPGVLRTILFTDIESSTTLTQRLGDAGAQEVLRAHNTILRDALKSTGGSEIKHTGDGIMASFASASQALDCAIRVQRAVAGHTETPFRVRVGLNAGEPVAEESDLFGTAVQLARRICDQAEGGQILVSNVVRELVSGKGFLFADTGEVALKGFEDPVRLYELRWREDA